MSTVSEGRFYGKHVRQSWVQDGVGYIPLAGGAVALADPELLPLLVGNWSVSAQGYPQRRDPNLRRTVLMHQVITNNVGNRYLVVDHINGDKLDNRSANLRIATRGENNVNVKRLSRRNTSGYRGVHWYTQRQCWRAVFSWQGRTYTSCGHTTAENAARAYDALVQKHGPRIAFLNFPDEAA